MLAQFKYLRADCRCPVSSAVVIEDQIFVFPGSQARDLHLLNRLLSA